MNFRFTLSNSIEGSYTLTQDPKGWRDSQLAIKRDNTFKGLFFDFTAKLNFFCGGGGKEYIDAIYDTQGVEGTTNILIEIDCSDSGLFDTLYEGVLNFASYKKILNDPEYTIVGIEQAGIEQILKTRYDSIINLNKLQTIDGTTLTDFNFGPYKLNLHSKEIDFSSLLSLGDLTTPSPFYDNGGTPTNVNLFANLDLNYITYDDIPGISIPDVNEDAYPGGTLLSPIFQNTGPDTVTYKIDVAYTGKLNGGWTNSGAGTFSLDLAYATGIPISSPAHLLAIGGTHIIPASGTPFNVDISFTGSYTVTVGAGQNLYLFLSAEGFNLDGSSLSVPIPQVSATLTTFSGSIKITEASTTTASTCNAFGIFEVGARLAQSITNTTDAFRSDFFGRKNAQPYASAQNGCGSFTAITNGYQIRGFPIADSGVTPNLVVGRPIYTSFKDFFESLSAVYNLGLGIDNGQYIRIEPIEYFYSTEVLFQIPNIKNYSIRSAEEFYMSGFELGYDKWESESTNGLDEFNTKRSYTTQLKKNGTNVSKLSKYMASAYALELTRRKPYTGQSTEDTTYDQENFLICLNRGVDGSSIPTNLAIAEKGENFTAEKNVIGASTMYNFRISPGRIARRWFKTVASSLIKMNSVLRTVKLALGQGNYKMVTTGTDACDSALRQPLDESANLDIPVPAIDSSLDPIFEPEFIEFEAPMTYNQYKLIKANPTKCLEISPYASNFIKAFIYDLRYNVVRGTAKFVLLKAYAPDNDCSHLYVEAGYVECGYVE